MSGCGVVEAIEAHYLTLVLDGLHRAGVLRALVEKEAKPEMLAARLDLDPSLLAPLLDFAAARSNLLVRDPGGSFQYSNRGRSLVFVEHMLDQYVGGYGPPLAQLVALLHDPSGGRQLVDESRHADAFAGEAGSASAAEAVSLILDFGATSIADLGCGGGHLICDAAEANPELQAFGVDANPDAVAKARARACRQGVDARVEIVCADALEALAALEDDRRHGIQLVIASSMLNGLWGSFGTVAEFLRRLASLLPGRVLLVLDYFSQLSRGETGGDARTLIHDVAQLVSGQGLPPSSSHGWLAAYERANAEILHCSETKADGIGRFVHIVRLADRA